MHHFFGTWPNLMQGLIGSIIGSAVGVAGAYLAAARTIAHDRKARREQASADAAAAILETVLPLPKWIHKLRDPDYQDPVGLPETMIDEWRTLRANHELSTLRYSHLLPDELRANARYLNVGLDSVLVWHYVDDEGPLDKVMPADDEVLADIQAFAGLVQNELTGYGHALLAPSPRPRLLRRRRPR